MTRPLATLALVALLTGTAHAEDRPFYFTSESLGGRQFDVRLYEADGVRVKELPVKLDRSAGIAIAPVGRTVALSCAGTPCLYGADHKLAKLAQPFTTDAAHLPPSASLLGWDRAGQQVLYKVSAAWRDEARSEDPATLLGYIAYDSKRKPIAIRESFEVWGWTADGKGLWVWDAAAPGTLRRYELASHKLGQTVKLTCAERMQIDLSQDELVCALNERGKSQVLRQKLDGTALPPFSEVGAFAEHQWPRYSPDGRRVAWTRARERVDGRTARVDVMVAEVGGGAASDVFRCIGHCNVAWESPTTVLVSGAGGIELVDVSKRPYPARRLVHTPTVDAVSIGR